MFIFESNLNRHCNYFKALITTEESTIRSTNSFLHVFLVSIYNYIALLKTLPERYRQRKDKMLLNIIRKCSTHLMSIGIYCFVCFSISSRRSLDSVLELSYLHSLPLSSSLRLLSAITQTWSHFLRTIARSQYGQTFAHTYIRFRWYRGHGRRWRFLHKFNRETIQAFLIPRISLRYFCLKLCHSRRRPFYEQTLLNCIKSQYPLQYWSYF